MIIDLSKSRNDYFKLPTEAEILRAHIDNRGARQIRVPDVVQSWKEGNVIVGDKQGNLEGLMYALEEGYEPEIDSLSLVGKVKSLKEGSLLILPPNYRISGSKAGDLVVYSDKNLIKLDSVEIKRKLLGATTPRGNLSGIRKIKEQWSPEKVIGAAFNLLHENKASAIDNNMACYSWWGKDNHRRIVSVYRSIQGAEIKAFQNYVAFKLVVPRMKKELRTGKHWRTKELLNEDQISRREKNISRYERYIKNRNIFYEIKQLDVDFSDLIETSGPSFKKGMTGKNVGVPSMSDREKRYLVKCTGVPLVERGDPLAYSVAWNLRSQVPENPDEFYRADRRGNRPHEGNDDDLFVSTGVAAFLSLQSMFEYESQTIPYLPFVIPTKETMEFVDNLRYNTLMLTYNPQTKRFSKRRLNHTEIENLVIKKTIADGYTSSFTADISTFKRKKYDLNVDLVKFKK